MMRIRKTFICFGKVFRIQIHLLLIPLLIAAYLGNYFSMFIISWGSACLHELTHIIIGKRLGISVSGIMFLPFGVCAPLKHPIIKQPAREILMAIVGPVCNLLLASVFAYLYKHAPSPLLLYGKNANLGMALLNLLPCLPLDGGRILRASLALSTDSFSAYRITASISRMIAVVLFVIGSLLLMTARFQFSLLMIGAFLLGNLCTEQRNISRQTLEELLYHNKKLDKNALNTTMVLTAYPHLSARSLLRKLSYHRYCMIHVVDKNRQLLYTLTEDEILHALLHRSIRITLEEIYALKNT